MAVGVVALGAGIAVAAVVLGGDPDDADRGTESSGGDDEWPPQDPSLLRSIRIDEDVERPQSVRIAGDAAEMYVAIPTSGETVVRRFDDGEEAWETTLEGEGWLLSLEDDLLLLTADGETGTIVSMLDTGGDVLWTNEQDGHAYGQLHDGRTFVIDASTAVTEIDSRSGDELNELPLSSGQLDPVEERVYSVSDGEVQRYDLDLEPVGDPIAIEESGIEFYPYVYRVLGGGVLYVAGGALVEVGLDGEEHYRCPISVSEPSSIDERGDGLLAVRSYDAMSIVESDGTECDELWSGEASFDYSLDEEYVVDSDLDLDTYEPLTSELLDVRTGDVLIRRDGAITITDDGYLVADEDELRLETVPDGDVVWTIDTAAESDWFRLGDAIGIVDDEGEMLTIEIYAD